MKKKVNFFSYYIPHHLWKFVCLPPFVRLKKEKRGGKGGEKPEATHVFLQLHSDSVFDYRKMFLFYRRAASAVSACLVFLKHPII